MNILYDYQAFFLQHYGGVSRCFAELMTHLPAEVQYSFAIKESDNIYMKEYAIGKNVAHLSKTVDNFLVASMFKGKGRLFDICNKLFPAYPSSINLNRNCSIEALKQQKFDVFHPTFFDDYFLKYLGNKPFVLTIHDMIPELYPHLFYKNEAQVRNKQKLATKATQIIAVSQYTKNKIVELFEIPSSKITVVHHGYNDSVNFELLRREPRLIMPKYFLYMGMRTTYKNFRPFIVEMARILNEFPEYNLVCTGAPFTNEEMRVIKALNIEKQVIHLFTSSEELNNLLANAEAFIYPSLDEGFGMPILEAFAAGCPVILNNTSCFPEIAGNGALYFELNDKKKSLYECVISFINSTDVTINSLKLEAYKRLSSFSWDKAVKELLEVYSKCYH